MKIHSDLLYAGNLWDFILKIHLGLSYTGNLWDFDEKNTPVCIKNRKSLILMNDINNKLLNILNPTLWMFILTGLIDVLIFYKKFCFSIWIFFIEILMITIKSIEF